MRRAKPWVRAVTAAAAVCASTALAPGLACGGGSDGGARGEPWHVQASGTAELLRSVSAVDEDTAWVAGLNDTLLRTTDGGVTWSALSAPITGYDYTSVSAADARTAWAVGSRFVVGDGFSGRASVVLGTADGGATWSVQVDAQPPTASYGVTSVLAVDASTAWAVGESSDGGGLVLRTVDAGATWQRLSIGLTGPFPGVSVQLSTIAARDGATAWVGGGSGCGPGVSCAALARTSDGGATWTSVGAEVAGNGDVSSLAMGDAGSVWLVTSGDVLTPGTIRRNAGSGWSVVRTGPPVITAIAAIDASTAWAVASSAAEPLVRTTDGGATWTAQETPPVEGLDAISVVRSRPDVAWAVGPRGTILKTTAALR